MSHIGRSGGLTGFVEAARQVGLNPFRLAATVGVPRAALLEPDIIVASELMELLLEEAGTQSGLPDFSLRAIQSRNLASMGILGLALREQPTLRAALNVMADFLPVANEAYRLEYEIVRGVVFVRIRGVRKSRTQVAQGLVGVVHQSMEVVLGDHWRPLEICFPHPAPDDLREHLRVFGQTPSFNRDFLGLVLARDALDTPIPTADPAIARELSRHLEELAAARAGGLPARVRELMLPLLPTGACTAERVADLLGIDRRTLHRRLAADGLVFSEVLDGVRADLAHRLLADVELPLSEVARQLGFARSSAFSHWFRRRYRTTARAYRANVQAAVATAG